MERQTLITGLTVPCLGCLLVPAIVGLYVDTPLTAFLICAGAALLGIPLLRGLSVPALPVKP